MPDRAMPDAGQTGDADVKHRQDHKPDPNFEARAVYLGENPFTKLRCAREVMGTLQPKDPVLKGTPSRRFGTASSSPTCTGVSGSRTTWAGTRRN